MAKLTNLLAHLRGRTVRQILLGLTALLAFAMLQFGATHWAHAQQVGADFDHASTGYVLNAQHQDVRCETCHLKGVFKGTPKDCASCHGWNNPRASTVMPTDHIPTRNATCESCHQANMAQFMDAVRNFNHAAVQPLICVNCHSSNNPHPGVRTNPVDPTHMAVLAKGQGCDQCHTTAQFSGPKKPANHIPIAPVPCESCHTDTDYAVMPTFNNIHAYAPSTSGNCQDCHGETNARAYSTPKMTIKSPASVANHIPMGGGQDCSTCHVGAGSSITSTPVTEGSSFGGSLFNHAGATEPCAKCHGENKTFYGVSLRVISDLQPAHVSTNAACETCHLAGAPAGLVPAAGMITFANAQFSHTGITTNCVACHGPTLGDSSFYGITKLIVMPATSPAGTLSHMPTSTTCENCHAGSTPPSPVPAVSPRALGTSLFRNSPPSSSQIHSGVSSGCGTCHGGSSEWVGVNLSIYNPNSLALPANSSTRYTGFQTRPGSGGLYSVPDTNHPTNDTCEQCHTSTAAFTGVALPNGHIPYAPLVVCGACHDSQFSNHPSIAAIHANIQSQTTNCEQCHSNDNVAQFASTTTRRAIKTPAPNHIPMVGLGCASCHVGTTGTLISTPVTASSFAGGGFIHNGIATGCAECHGKNVTTGTFDGVNPLTVANQSPAHIPVNSNIGCEICHANSVPPGLVPSTPVSTTAFASGKFIHTGITTGCVTCHVTGVGPFKGVSNLVVMPSTAAPSGHIPSSTTCESCHLGSVPAGLLSVSGSPASSPNTLFANSPPNGSLIHADVSGGCISCHEAGNAWIGMGMSIYQRSPSSRNNNNAAQLYTGFHTRPGGSGTYSWPSTSHPGTGECSQCHGNTDAFGPPALSTSHIPYKAGALCEACHVSWTTLPTISAIHLNLPTSSTCQDCHSGPQANADKYGAKATRKIVQPLITHVPMRNLDCAACHIGGNASMATPAQIDIGKFSGSGFSHTGMTTGCSECHGPTVTGYQGIALNKIIIMPPTGLANSSNHIPSSTTCENCHIQNMPSSQVVGNAAQAAPGSGFKLPAPATEKIHTGMTGGCSACHAKDMDWMSVGVYTRTTTGPLFRGFQTRPYGTPTTPWAINDSLHTPNGECSNCHSGFTGWSGEAKPAVHIPTDATCGNCHTSSDYAEKPLNANIHANMRSTAKCADCHSNSNAILYSTTTVPIARALDPNTAGGHIPMATLDCKDCHVSTANTSMTTVTGMSESQHFTNSAFSHNGVAATSCATCHGTGKTSASFQGSIPNLISFTTWALPKPHVPSSLDCGVCHTSIPTGLVKDGSGGTFASGKFSHGSITTGCDACHGTGQGAAFQGTTTVVLPAITSGTSSHIPSPIVTKCETCHLSNMPSALVSAVATAASSAKFVAPAPTGGMIHTGVSGSCIDCHENAYTWKSITTLYPAKNVNKVFTGFQTRPNAAAATATSYLDANHPTGGDCGDCHGSTENFTAAAKPGNHIPTSTTAQCQNCHTSLTSGSVVNNVATTASFNQWSSGTRMDFALIHRYAPSTTSNCAQCHSEANAKLYAITSIGFAIKSPADTVKPHVPYGTVACEVCHVFTTSVSNSSKFDNGQFIHTGITTGCEVCHGSGYTAGKYQGITAMVAIAASTTTPGSQTHIPYSAGCEGCHSPVPSGLLSVTAAGTGFANPLVAGTAIHAKSSGILCTTCHGLGYQWLGADKYTRTPTSGSALPTNASSTTIYKGFQTRPGTTGFAPYGYNSPGHVGDSGLTNGECSDCHSGTTQFTAEGKPTGHMPNSAAACSSCHGANYSATGLVRTGLHSGVTIPTSVVPYTATTLAGNASCKTCHTVGTGGTSGTAPFAGCKTPSPCSSPAPVSSWQPITVADVPSLTHIPIKNLSCDACHVGTTAFTGVGMGNKPAGTTMHNNVKLAGIKCLDCHENGMKNMWTGVTMAIRTPNKHTSTNSKAPNDCSNCHSFNGGFNRGQVRPIMRSAQVAPDTGTMRPVIKPGNISRGSLGNTFDHTGVEVGKCKTCHNGKAASGMPARHLMVVTSCDTCHRTSTWLPAQFDHKGVSPNTCQACHNGMSASGRPSGHFNTTRSCDVCHKNMSWTPVSYQHLSLQYVPSPDKPTCVSCHTTNGELMRRQMRGLTRTKPIPVGQ